MASANAPLIDREPSPPTTLPPTWCVVQCEQGCDETWTLDTADFTPALTVADVERLLTPLLLEHEQAHEGAWR